MCIFNKKQLPYCVLIDFLLNKVYDVLVIISNEQNFGGKEHEKQIQKINGGITFCCGITVLPVG